VARGLAVLAALAVSLLAVSGAGGADAQTPRAGGTVRFGELSEPPCLNPLLARCLGPGGFPTLAFLAEKVLEPEFVVSPDFTWRPQLVSGVTFTRKPPFTLTYRIQPRARWSDGVPVTARDFVFTLRARIARKDQLDEATRGVVEQVRSASAVGAKAVRVVLRERHAGWHSLFGNILPRHALAGEDLGSIWADGIVNPKTGRPIGSGPFLVERWERGEQLTLVRNPRYWGRRAYLDRLVLRFRVEGSQPVEWFRRGELDIAWAFPAAPGALGALRQERGLRLVTTPPSASWDHFAIRIGPGGHPALKNKLVRRALAYGIDRTALIRQVLGSSSPNHPPHDSVVIVRPSPHYRPNWSGYSRRPAEARRLLEQAGCRSGADGIYVCAGQRLSLRFVTSAGIPPRAQLISLAQAQLRQVGIEVVPTFAPPPVFLGQILPQGGFDVALFGWTGDPSGTGLNAIFGCGGELNYTGYCQRLVTRDLDQANRILDASQQARVLNRADRQMAQDVPALPLYQIPLPAAFRTTIHNYALSPNPLTTSGEWWLER
jgi:peptide/nickel transport system substrate-binding protein